MALAWDQQTYSRTYSVDNVGYSREFYSRFANSTDELAWWCNLYNTRIVPVLESSAERNASWSWGAV
jgi:hypothetical protein